ncbi:hypothetical protein ACFXAZ_34270 [Streptomyces sp. NPDC059477]|uniref:hypothetical protein n=1 Tax=Streptomyces sp. NPDC059477 TaxID=3346847 RepID=UPI003695CE71
MTQPHRAASSFGAITLLFALSGCTESEGTRDYAVPNSACGTAIDADALSSFLPAGKKITTEETSRTSDSTKCAISVDGKLIIQIAQEWWNNMSILDFSRGMTLDDPDQHSEDGLYSYSGYQAFSKVEGCRSSEHADQVLFAAIQAPGSDHRDSTAMQQLITEYTQEIEKSPACDQN